MTQIQENYIIVENVLTHEIEQILMDLANLYYDTDSTDGFQLFRKKGNDTSFLICFTNQLDFERFNYFVNYIHYPKNAKPHVKGFYNVKDIDIDGEYKIGNWVLIFVSKSDKEYDNVTIVNENHEHFLFDFGGKTTKLNSIEETFNLVPVEKEDYNHIIDIIPDLNKIESKPWWKFW